MHVKGFLHKLLVSVMHKKRLTTLILLIQTVLKSKKLSLTQLGRELELSIQERSGIKRADRFLGNKKLESYAIYSILAKTIIGTRTRPWIIVDWSEVPNSTFHILRAAMVTTGRALTFYEEVHSEKQLYNAQVEKMFLLRLKNLLPHGCSPIIVTDAGFHNQWFKEVIKSGFDYVGRIRSNKQFSQDQGRTWKSHTNLFAHATVRPKSIGKVLLCKNSIETQLYIVKAKHKGRASLNCAGKKRSNSVSLRYRKAGNDPWLLASSLTGSDIAKKVVKIYQKRMQIEEGFRDLKSSRYGFSFEHSYPRRLDRVCNLLIIGTLASFIAWLTGWMVEKLKLQRQFQVNTIKNRRVLSLFYLGCRAIKRGVKIPPYLIKNAIKEDLIWV